MAQITLPVPKQFNFNETVLSHGWYMLAPFSLDKSNMILYRIHQTHDGTVLQMAMQQVGKNLQIIVAGDERLSPSVEYELSDVAMRIFNTDWNLRPFYSAMQAHEGYDWLEKEGKGRILVSPTVWEDLAKVLFTTNTTWAQTIQMSQRLCRLGTPHPTLGDAYAFPTPKQIAEMDFETLAEQVRAGYRTAYLHELAQKIVSGELNVEAWATDRTLDSNDLFKQIRALKGFGDYAAGTLLRMFGHFDKIAIDSAARTMYANRHNKGEKGTDRDIHVQYEPFGEWRGLVLWMDIMRD